MMAIFLFDATPLQGGGVILQRGQEVEVKLDLGIGMA